MKCAGLYVLEENSRVATAGGRMVWKGYNKTLSILRFVLADCSTYVIDRGHILYNRYLVFEGSALSE